MLLGLLTDRRDTVSIEAEMHKIAHSIRFLVCIAGCVTRFVRRRTIIQ